MIFLVLRLRLRTILREYDTILVGKPMTRLEESLVEHPHGQRYRVAMRPTDEATEGVAPRAERQTGMMVLMERAQTFVAHDAQTESLGDPLNG
jgi:hypothetical protein